jgi:hypothetical protein
MSAKKLHGVFDTRSAEPRQTICAQLRHSSCYVWAARGCNQPLSGAVLIDFLAINGRLNPGWIPTERQLLEGGGDWRFDDRMNNTEQRANLCCKEPIALRGRLSP